MKILKNISLKNIFISTFTILTIFILSIIITSLYGKYHNNKISQLENQIYSIQLQAVQISDIQDNLFLYNSSSYIKGNRNYHIYISKINNINKTIDSIVENSSIASKYFVSSLLDIKNQYLIYEQEINKILDINSDIYNSTNGINIQSFSIKKKLYNETEFKRLNYTKYIDSIDFYKDKLFNDRISKKDFQKASNNFIKIISASSNQQERYYTLLFIDKLTDIYNNYTLEYNKTKTIGRDYNEGMLNTLHLQQISINYKIAELISNITALKKNSFRKSVINYGIFSLILLILNFFVFKYIYDILYKPWKNTEPVFPKLSNGELPTVEVIDSLQEFELITANLKTLVNNLSNKNTFIEKLAKRDYSVEFTPDKKDVLGQSLFKLKQDLIEAEKKSLQYSETEQHQKWTASGIAKIGAVMRQFTEDINILAKNILHEILEYVDAVQGVIYLYNKEGNYLMQSASFSYGKLRLKKTKILPYEGLLGTILIEKREYFYDKIPEDYIFLETGFGYAKPKSLFAFPLLFENAIYGVIEIASLDIIPKYKRDFLLTLANEIAITISYTEINVQTKVLLEQSKKQADELKSNEKLFKKNQDNLKSLLRMTEEHLNETHSNLKEKEKIVREKVEDFLKLEKELNSKEEYIENIVNEYENIKSELENHNAELRKRIEQLENRLNNENNS